MTPTLQSAGSAPLPPLPDLKGAAAVSGQAAQNGQQDAMASILSGVAPVKVAVDSILAACRQIVTSGAVPGAEQPCAQIVALATSLLPMAAQQALQPGQGGGIGPVQPGPQGLGGPQ